MASVAYSVCPGAGSLLSGSPTIAIASGVATFGGNVASQNEQHPTFGVGVEISYNDGTARKGYIASKVSASVWNITDAVGAAPPDCGASAVSAIAHCYASMSAAEAGCNDANHTNNVNITAAGANLTALNIPCYCEQATYTADTTAVTWNAMTGDTTHRPYIYSPTSTTTECNLAMFPTTPKYGVTKYRLIVNAATMFTKSTTANFMVVHNIQMYSTYTGTSSNLSIQYSHLANENNSIYSCLIFITDAATTGARNIIRQQGNVAGANFYIYNNILVYLNGAGAVLSNGIVCVTGTSTITAYSNTIYGLKSSGVTGAPLFRSTTANVINSLNNTFINNDAACTVNTKNYDCYDRDESEANGTLTTQTDAQLFKDVSDPSPLNWDWTPLAGSDLLDNGSTLGAPYNVDILGTTRPEGSAYDCGAVEYIIPGTPTLVACSPASGSELGGTLIEITGTYLELPSGITINSVACTSIVLVSSTKITCITPAGVAGTYDIVVTISGTPYTLSSTFTYGTFYAVTLSSGANSVKLPTPLWGYKTIVSMPLDFSELNNGSSAGYDNGAAYDKRICKCTFELSPAEMGLFQTFLYTNARGKDVVMTLASGSGFHPFGADKGDVGAFTVSFVVVDHRGIGPEPWLYFHIECEITNTGAYPSYTPPDQVAEGGMSIGTVTALRFPQQWFKPKTEYSVNVQHSEGSLSSWVDRGDYGDSFRTAFSLGINESKCAALLAYITGTIRATNFGITPVENAYPFGYDKGGDGSSVSALLTNGDLEITHNRYNDFTFDMEATIYE